MTSLCLIVPAALLIHCVLLLLLRAPGRPRNSWIMQIGSGMPLSIRREWRKAQDHGHHGESSQRTSAVYAS